MLVEAVVKVLSVCHICLQQVFREGLASAERDGADRRPLNQATDPCEVAWRGRRGWGRIDMAKVEKEQRGMKL